MPDIVVKEKFGAGPSARGSQVSDELEFILAGPEGMSREAMLAALLVEAPQVYDGRPISSYGLHGETAPGFWEGYARYESPDGSAATKETGEESFSFDTTGGTEHANQSKRTVGRYPATAPDLGGAIGFDGADVAGVDVTVPTFKFSATAYLAPEVMTEAYVATLYFTTGHTNQFPWTITVDGVPLSFDAGEVLFLGARGGKRARGDWEIAFEFAASPNRYAITDIPGIPVASKRGWEYLWVRYQPRDPGVGEDESLSIKPIAVYVEQVYLEADFGPLGF